MEKCAATALNSKLIAGQKDFFSKIVVDAVMMLDELLPLKMIGVKKVQGGALEVRNGLGICSLALFTRHTNQIWFPPLNSIHFFTSQDSQLVAGVAFKKTFSYAGFEMQPKRYVDLKIALLNIELELKAEKDNAEVRVNNVEVRTTVSIIQVFRESRMAFCN